MTSQNIHFTHLISSKLISSLLSADIIIQITILVKTFFLTKYQKIPPTLLDSMGTLWYNKHNTKDEKRDRFSVMCLLNRCEASRFAACTYGIMIAETSAKQIFTASLSCALRSCIIDGRAKTKGTQKVTDFLGEEEQRSK